MQHHKNALPSLKLVSFWDGLFSGAMLVSGRAWLKKESPMGLLNIKYIYIEIYIILYIYLKCVIGLNGKFLYLPNFFSTNYGNGYPESHEDWETDFSRKWFYSTLFGESSVNLFPFVTWKFAVATFVYWRISRESIQGLFQFGFATPLRKQYGNDLNDISRNPAQPRLPIATS